MRSVDHQRENQKTDLTINENKERRGSPLCETRPQTPVTGEAIVVVDRVESPLPEKFGLKGMMGKQLFVLLRVEGRREKH